MLNSLQFIQIIIFFFPFSKATNGWIRLQGTVFYVNCVIFIINRNLNLYIYHAFFQDSEVLFVSLALKKVKVPLMCTSSEICLFELKCESQYLDNFYLPAFLWWGVGEGKNDHLTWASHRSHSRLSLSASSTCPDTLHGARHGEGSGISQRHHRVWTATAWPLQVRTHHVAPTDLHHKHSLPVACWAMVSLNASWKCPNINM